MSEKRNAQHSFLKGLQTDKAIINTTNEELSDALNVVLTTAASNQFTLQSETGNIVLRGDFGNVDLPAGFRVMAAEQRDGVIYFVLYNPSTQTTELGTYPSPVFGGTNTFRQTVLGRRVVTNLIDDALYDIFTPQITLESGLNHEFFIERADGSIDSLDPFIAQGPIDVSNDSLNRDRIVSEMTIDNDWAFTSLVESTNTGDAEKAISANIQLRSSQIKGYQLDFQGQTTYVRVDNPANTINARIDIDELDPDTTYEVTIAPWTDFGFAETISRTITTTEFEPEFTLEYISGTTFRITETEVSGVIPATAQHTATVTSLNTLRQVPVEIQGLTRNSPFNLGRINGTNTIDAAADISGLGLTPGQLATLLYTFVDENGNRYNASGQFTVNINGGADPPTASNTGVTSVQYDRLRSSAERTAVFNIIFRFESAAPAFVSYEWLTEPLEFIVNSQVNMNINATLVVGGRTIANIDRSRFGIVTNNPTSPAQVDHTSAETRVITASLFVSGLGTSDSPGSANFNVRFNNVPVEPRVLQSSGGLLDIAYDGLITNTSNYSEFTTPTIQFTFAGNLNDGSGGGLPVNQQ